MDTTRRAFLKQAGLATAAATAWHARSYAAIPGANDRVRVGLLGCGNRMRDTLIPAFLQHNRSTGFELVAVANLCAHRRATGARFVQREQRNCIVETVCSSEELFLRSDVDAVIIATDDRAHARHGVQAVRCGLDAYIETPSAHGIAEARELRQAVQQSRRVVQIGTHRRSDPMYQQMRERMRAGDFGDMLGVEIAHTMSDPSLVHRLDTLQWLTGYPCPSAVVVNGGMYTLHDGTRNWKSLNAVLYYGPTAGAAHGFRVSYAARPALTTGAAREAYHFANATFDMSNLHANGTGSLATQPTHADSRTMALAQTSAHMRNWMECVRNRQAPNSCVNSAYSYSVAEQMLHNAM